MPRYDWLLLDLDGTVLDYTRAETDALHATLTGLGLAVDDALTTAYREINAAAWTAYERGELSPAELRVRRWRELIGRHGLDADAEATAQAYVENLAAGHVALEGALDAVEALACHHRIGVVTNGFASVQRPRMAASGVDRHAEVVVISDEVGHSKPDPAIFDVAFAAMGQPDRRRVLMVGDSLASDVAGGVAYGLDTAWVAPPGAAVPPADLTPTFRVAALSELVELL
ncbi:MAG: YjjG family noncanonical pyrimidine nucleotidase [Actinomycetes bacterium]